MREPLRPDSAIASLQDSLDEGAGLCLLIGAGLTINATGDPNCTWRGLIMRGAAAAERYRDRDWVERVVADANTGRLTDMLVAAEKVTDALGDHFRGWLREEVGSLEATHFELLAEIKRLVAHDRVIPVTTNYDGILHRYLGFEQLTWRDDKGDLMDAFARLVSAVIHIHGYWVQSKTVVFGSTSYQAMQSHGVALEAFKRILMANAVVTVGVGAGLDDPTFQVVLGWAGRVLDQSRAIYYLHKDGDEVPQHSHIIPVPLSSYKEIAPFLARLEINPARPGRGGGLATGESFRTSDLQAIRERAASLREDRTTLRARDFMNVYGDQVNGILAGTVTPAARVQAWTSRLLTTWRAVESA